jgi:hypothetical protein
LKEDDIEEVVEDGWGRRETDIITKVARCTNKLKRWGIRKKNEI